MNLKLGNAVRTAADRAARTRESEGLVAPGEEIQLGESFGKTMGALLLQGFATPEVDGVWSALPTAKVEVRLRATHPDHRYRVVMTAMRFEGTGHRALVAASVNGGPFHQVLSVGGWQTVEVDCHVESPGKKFSSIVIEFQVANPMSPSALGMGDDHRLLGFKLSTLRVVDLDAQGEQPGSGDGSQAQAAATLPGTSAEPLVAQVEVQPGSSATPREMFLALANRGPLWRKVLLDINPAVRVVRWMRRLSRATVAMQQQLDQIRIDSAMYARDLAERVNAVEIDASGKEEEQQRSRELAGTMGAQLGQLQSQLARLDDRLARQDTQLETANERWLLWRQESEGRLAASQLALDDARAATVRMAAELDAMRLMLMEAGKEDRQFMDRTDSAISQLEGLLAAAHEKLDGTGLLASQTAELFSAAHQKLDGTYALTSQTAELISAAHQKLDRIEAGVAAGSGAGGTQRQVMRISHGWIIDTGFGHFSCDERDDLLAICLAEYGDVERGLRLLLERVLQPGDVFVDVGANIGLHTVVAAHRVGTSGRVYAIEAMPRTIEHLRSSLRLSGVEDVVELLPVAAGARAEDGHVFHIGAVSGHSSLYPLEDAISTVQVDIRPIDQLIHRHDVKLVKIDVEGAELDVIEGMAGLIDADPSVGVIAEYAVSHLARVGVATAQWEAMRAAHGFDMFLIDDMTGECTRLEGFAELAERVSSNLLFCRPQSPLPGLSRIGIDS